MSIRTEQVSENLKIHLSEVIIKELEIIQGIILSISSVEVSLDLKHADIFISVYPENKSKSIIKHLAKNAKHLRHELTQNIQMKSVPFLHFKIKKDARDIKSEVEMLLDKIKEEKKI